MKKIKLLLLLFCFCATTCIAQKKVYVNLKVYLQGAYSTSLGRHKDVTSGWASILNANALSHPYGGSPWNCGGTASVASNFFTSTSAATDIVDWVLIQLRSANDPSEIAGNAEIPIQKAAFVREDGMIVDTDGSSVPRFDFVSPGYYFVSVQHRNHLGVISSTTLYLDSISTPTLYDFTTAQAQGYYDSTIASNGALANPATGVYGMWAGDANADGSVKYTGPNNDPVEVLGVLGGNQNGIISNTYNNADLNMDGTVKYTGPNNDAVYVLGVLGGNQTAIYRSQSPPTVLCELADAGPDKFICSGGSTTIGASSVTGYNYKWTPNNTLNDSTIAQPTASPTSTTTYTVTMLPVTTANLLTNGDFESGNSGFSSDLLFGHIMHFGYYEMLSSAGGPNCGSLYNHGTSPGLGQFIVAYPLDTPAIPKNTRIWYETVNVNSNTGYTFSGWSAAMYGNFLPGFSVRLVGNSTGTFDTEMNIPSCGNWQPFYVKWNSGNNTSVRIEIRFNSTMPVNHADRSSVLFDDLYFGICNQAQKFDQVTVNVATGTPSISPAGPITYYNQYETMTKAAVLTSSSAGTYQWYKNGVAISGATNQTYTIDESGNDSHTSYYTCGNSCGTSNTVTFNYIGCDSDGDYPVTITHGGCVSGMASPNYIQLYAPNLGSGTTYSWWLENNPTCFSIVSTNHLQASSCSSFQTDGVFTSSSKGNERTYMYYVIVANTGCRNSSDNPTKTDNPVETKPAFSIRPNPANSQINISSEVYIRQVEIYDMAGRLVKRVANKHDKEIQVDTQAIKAGTYTCKVITEKETKVSQLIIQH